LKHALINIDPAALSPFQIVRFLEVVAKIEWELRGGTSAPVVPKIEVIIGESEEM
jgi:hypothetical protein